MAEHRICSVEGCGKPTLARRLCRKHYARLRRQGHTDETRRHGLSGVASKTSAEWLHHHVSFNGGDCLIWPLYRNAQGYGIAMIDGRRERASREMCRMVNGEPPTERHEAAHSCGNGHEGCVHPKHLRWATRKENAADAIDHGTWNHGEKVPQAILTEAQVREIRRLKGKMLQREIAALFGVTPCAVGRIHRGQNWAWLS